ncbi:Protein of unknown function [Bacillus mycoides]|nr:Protein of unknown function [Bacillus mycoides]
MMLASVSHCN